MQMKHLNEIDKAVLFALFRRRKIGRNHIRLKTLMKCGFKSNEKNLVKKAVKGLINKGLIVWAKKSEKALCLNKLRLKEIKKLLGVWGEIPMHFIILK